MMSSRNRVILSTMSTRARTKTVAAAAATATGYVALYLRISEDKSGRVEGVKAQEKWGRAYAAQAWPGVPVRVFADNDLSAAKDDVVRPAYERLREAVAAGDVAQLWTVEQSRLERREVGWFTLAAELDAAGIDKIHTRRDGIVHILDDVAGIKAVLAAGEVRKLRKRVTDKAAELAAEGRPGGGVAYGYRSVINKKGQKDLEIVDEQAAVIREVADWVLDGWSLARIAGTLKDRGMSGATRRRIHDQNGEIVMDGDGQPMMRPSQISPTAVKSWITKATVAGLRAYKGELITATWPAILDRATWDAVRDKLTNVRTVKAKDGTVFEVNPVQRNTGRRYLLTGGTARCGVCEAPLTAVERALRGKRKVYYQCHPNQGGRGCVGIIGDPFEAHVVAEMLDELDRPEVLAELEADEHAARREDLGKALRDLETQRREGARMWAKREITSEEWTAARGVFDGDERTLRADLRAIPAPVGRVDPESIREGWAEMNLDERRDFISMFVKRVTVVRARPGTMGFDKDRVKVQWRHGDGRDLVGLVN